jgi:hypothetical protein
VSHLDSPPLTITAAGQAILSFSHRWSFEQGFWDGGQVRVSVNGGAFTTVPAGSFTSNGYNGTVIGNSSSGLAGQQAFVENSPGFVLITSVAILGTYNPGDIIRVRFTAANDENTQGAFVPNWEIDSLQINQGSEQNATFTVGASVFNEDKGANADRNYQWYRNDGAGWVLIPGASSSTYSLVPTSADNGAQFRVDIFIPGASATSSAATLTVGGPEVTITRSGGQTTISWSGPYCLQETSSLDGTPVWGPSSVANGVAFTPGPGNKFYRLTDNCP